MASRSFYLAPTALSPDAANYEGYAASEGTYGEANYVAPAAKRPEQAMCVPYSACGGRRRVPRVL